MRRYAEGIVDFAKQHPPLFAGACGAVIVSFIGLLYYCMQDGPDLDPIKKRN
jgi:hypothetical protein